MKIAILLTAAALSAATGASAQSNGMATKPTTPVTKPHAAMSATPAMTSKPATSGHMVATTNKAGKKVTYDCSKKGNMTKKACKG